jgi:hypothetical protein
MEEEKSFQRGLIVMGDLLGEKNKMSWRDHMVGLEDALFKRWELKRAFEKR